MSINNNKLIFNELTAVIKGNMLDGIIEKYQSDYRVQHFDTKSHLFSMLYFNLKGTSSLRDLQTHLSCNTKLKRLINVPSVSQFSRQNAKRDFRVFEDIFYHLVNHTKKKFGKVRLEKDLPQLKIIDSTMITLAVKLAPHLKLENKSAGIKISTLYNGKYPEKVQIVKGITSDRRCINGFFEDKEAIHLFDRGYYDYRWYDSLSEKGIKFITRGIHNAVVMEEEMLYTDPKKDIYDTRVIMGSTPGGNLTFREYREIMTFNEDGEPITFITNIFDLSTEEIISLYRRRWEIEVFFKWVKQNLRIKKWIGYNENAVKIQVYTALIVYLLLYILKNTLKSKASMLHISRVVRANLLEEIHEDTYGYLTG